MVTSAAGAAFHDIRTVAFRRGGVRLVLSPAVVQGEAAPESIVRAIDLLERYPGLDVMIVGRGGGSGEDLMAFNHEQVVRRVAAARVPVVSAVGHEVDLTLCDLAADVRAATPSQAAELVIPDASARRELLVRQTRHLLRAMQGRLLEERSRVERLRGQLSDPRFLIAERQQSLDELGSRLERATTRTLARRRALVVDAERRLSARHPRAVLAQARARLAPLEARLGAAAGAEVGRCRARAGELVARLAALSPLAVLARGYAIATLPGGRAIRAASEVNPGDAISIRVSAGRIGARVTDTEPGDGGS